MRNYTLSLFIFVFIFSLFNINFTNAANCAPGELFNTSTGKRCASLAVNTSPGEVVQEFKIGARGESVKKFQQTLAKEGFLFGKIDGIYGPITDGAAKNYYKKYPRPLPPIFPPEPCPLYEDGSGVITHFCPPPLEDGVPVISGVSGPQSLEINEKGSWTVKASSPNGGNLSYSVLWGDEGSHYSNNVSASRPILEQTATFSHVYKKRGEYKIIFTVTNENKIRCIKAPCPSSGGSAQVSLSVVVGDTIDDTDESPLISSLSPKEGPIGTRVNIYGVNLSDSMIYFGGYPVDPAMIDSSDTNNKISFVVPSNLNNCYGSQMCLMIYRPVTDGKYNVYVTNKNGKSNSVIFVVTGTKPEM